MDKFEVGQKVKYANYFMHDLAPQWYSFIGTKGIITALINTTGSAIVQWESGITSDNDKWACDINDLSIIKE